MKNSISMLPTLLKILQQKMMEEHIKYLETLDLSKQHVPYLMVLWNNREGLSQKEIIDKIRFDKAHTSRALKELVNKNIVIKEDKNGYKNKYFLAKSGLEIAQNIKLENQRIHEEVFAILTEEERLQIEKIVKKLTDHIVNK